jgi:uncharacterized phage protein (TIGR01671 family)
MREIKFRAWDKKLKKWVNSDAISITLSGTPMAPDETWMEHNLADLALMQFTGLHDKNGKEIWEGDIIRILEDTYWLYIGDICEVEWDECGGWYPFADNYDAMIYPYGYNVEVIGNVHENAELLK